MGQTPDKFPGHCYFGWVDSPLGQLDASNRLIVVGTTEGSNASDLPTSLSEELFLSSNGSQLGLTQLQFAEVLIAIGNKYSYAVAAGTTPTPAEREAFWRALQLQDLALATACALGINTAWEAFIARFRDFLERTAIGITGSSSLGKDLADSLYSELFGITEREGQRRSPLSSYSGRGSLAGWLRTTLAQRHVDHHRQTAHQTPLGAQDFPGPVPATAPPARVTSTLSQAVTRTISELGAEDRFLISSYFLDQRTLREISHLLHVHEATVSRRLKRLTENLHKRLLKHLQACGMSKRAAEEALGTDPRDLDVNLRSLLQDSQPPPFSNQKDTAKST
jgi:RNA polymerase sigma-70 factor (ECF subfamily)